MKAHSKPFQSGRTLERDTYERELNFYFNRGYVQQPETFFSFPVELPVYSLELDKPYRGGRYQIISYRSGYEARNPLIAERLYSHKQNRTAFLVRWTHGDSGRKTVICLHDHLGGHPRQAKRMFKIRALYRMGLDVVLVAAPFHWKRASRARQGSPVFLQPQDVGMTAECFGQAIHDVLQGIHILEKEGAGKIGVFGVGLGGYKAGLLAALTDRIDFAAMVNPLVKFNSDFSPLVLKYPFTVDHVFRVKLQRVWTMHTPLHFHPRINKSRILVIASRSDRNCPFIHARNLCEKWELPSHSFSSEGYRTVFGRPRWISAWHRFLGEMGFVPTHS